MQQKTVIRPLIESHAVRTSASWLVATEDLYSSMTGSTVPSPSSESILIGCDPGKSPTSSFESSSSPSSIRCSSTSIVAPSSLAFSYFTLSFWPWRSRQILRRLILLPASLILPIQDIHLLQRTIRMYYPQHNFPHLRIRLGNLKVGWFCACTPVICECQRSLSCFRGAYRPF